MDSDQENLHKERSSRLASKGSQRFSSSKPLQSTQSLASPKQKSESTPGVPQSSIVVTKPESGKKKGKKNGKEPKGKAPKEKAAKEKTPIEKELKVKQLKEKGKKDKSVTIIASEDADKNKPNADSRQSMSRSASFLHRSSASHSRVSFMKQSRSVQSMDEYSFSSSEEELAVKLKKSSNKGLSYKKKGKEKGRKGKKKEAEEVVAITPPIPPPPPPTAPEPPQDDIMEEIMRMKAAAEAGEEYVAKAPEEPKKKKKPPKKKKPKKTKLTAEMIEKMRIEAELEAARLAELEKKRLEEERKAAIEKDKREVVEYQIRLEQLRKSTSKLEDILVVYKENAVQEKELAEWEFYIACDRLPNPSLCDQMNTYLHLWELDINQTTMEGASKRTADVVKLLGDLQDLLDTSSDVELRIVNNWKWVRQMFRDHQKENLEVATYKLLRNIEKNLNHIDIPTADFNFKDDNLDLSIWLRVQLPIPLPNPRRPPKSRIEVDFDNVQMQVLFPISIDCDCMAIRSMYLKYDHLSDLCDNFYIPEIPASFSTTFEGNAISEWRTKLKYKYDHRDKKKVVEGTDDSEKKNEEEKEACEFSSDEEIPLVPYKKLQPTASELAISIEDAFYTSMKEQLAIDIPDHVINLRRFCVLGGVFLLNLVYQPPQPQHFVTMDLQMTKLYLPKKLEHVDFAVIYTPPEPPPPGVRRLPEEIEEEMKQQEEEMDKLMLITLKWPDHVIFLELPIVCYWDESEQVWSKKNIHDVKHNEEKSILTFRTGLFGTYGLATIRYVNLPFQAWEIKPEEDGSVTFQITAAILMLEFNVKEGLICLSQLQNSPNMALSGIIGEYFKLFKLKRMMKEAGIDIFPEPDAFCYIEGACEKHWPMEKHLYFNMAQLASCFNFAWSRWNLTAGRRSIVLQMREYVPTKSKQKTHSMLLVTPQKAAFIECTEVSQVFCEDDVEGLKFSADLYHLMKATHSITVRKRVSSSPWQLVYALYELLVSVRVLSFS